MVYFYLYPVICNKHFKKTEITLSDFLSIFGYCTLGYTVKQKTNKYYTENDQPRFIKHFCP